MKGTKINETIFIDENYFEYEYDQLLKELDIFDFSKFNDLINGLDRLGSNIVSTINSIHDTCEYFCNFCKFKIFNKFN